MRVLAAILPDGADLPADRTAPRGLEAALLCAEEPRLRRLVHRLLGWPAQAAEVDDVVQETLLAAWTHRKSYRGEAALATWLHRIAVRKCQGHARRAALRRRLFGWLERAPEPAALPVEADDRHDDMRQALQRLGHGDREVLVLRYLEQRPVEALVALLGCSRAAIDQRLSRARTRLRAELDEARR